MERIDIDALKGQLNKKLDEIENQIITIDEIEDKSYMDDRGGLEEANRIAERMEQYGDDEESQLLKSLDEGFLKLKSVRETKIIRKMRDNKKEDAKKEFVSELEKRQEERNARIQEIDEKVEKLENIRKDKLERQEEHENAKKVLKNSFQKLDNKIFKDLEGSIRKYADAVREKDNEIASLKQEKAEWEEDNVKLNDLINEVNGIEESIGKQAEVTEKPEEIEPIEFEEVEQNNNEVESKNSEAEQKEPEKTETKAPEREPKKAENLEPKIPEINPGKSESKKTNSTDEVEKELKEGGKKLTEFQKKVKEDAKKDPAGFENAVTGNQTEQPRLDGIKFYIDSNGTPTYTATIYKDNEKIDSVEIKGYDNITTKMRKALTEEQRKTLKSLNIPLLTKYCDPNIFALMNAVTEKYANIDKTDNEYIDIMRLKLDPTYNPSIDIDYDFTGLYNMPKDAEHKETLNFIKKIAKSNYNVGIAHYEKRPNIISRLMSRIKTKRIESTKKREEESNIDTLKNMYEVASKEPNFNEETFIKKAIEIRPGLSESYLKNEIKNSQTERNIDDVKKQNTKREMFMANVKVDSTNQYWMNSIDRSNHTFIDKSTLTYSDKAKADIEKAKEEVQDDEKGEI